MTSTVKGRPSWARNEPLYVQRLILRHRLTAPQLAALREYVAQKTIRREISHSTAVALRARGFGEIVATALRNRSLREHPKAEFELNPVGVALLEALTAAPEEDVPERKTRTKWDRHPKPAREKSRDYHPPEWDG